MIETPLDHDYSFDFVFEAATVGLRIQSQIDNYVQRSTDILDPLVRRMTEMFSVDEFSLIPTERRPPIDTDALVAEGFKMMAIASEFTDCLKEKEQWLDDELEGAPLSIRVLSGSGRKLIVSTYLSIGLTGSWQQEYGSVDSTRKNGSYRTALLGQNALVLYPQLMTGDQIDTRNYIVPILREDGEPNIAISTRERTWRDRLGVLGDGAPLGSSARYAKRTKQDLVRLRALASNC